MAITPRKGSAAARILGIAATTPAATQKEIAKLLNTTPGNVSQVYNRYGIDYKATEIFRQKRADILAGITERILASVSEGDIKAATLLQKATTVGILTDKERTERGLATSITDFRALSIELAGTEAEIRSQIKAIDEAKRAILERADATPEDDSPIDI